MPSKGKSTIGRREVTGIGRHCDIQKQAIRRTTPAVAVALYGIVNPGKLKMNMKNKLKPRISPINLDLVKPSLLEFIAATV